MSSRPAASHRVPSAPTAWRWPRIDATTLLIIYVVTLVILPSRLVVPGFGANGRPAELIGLALLGIWGLSRLLDVHPRGWQPARVGLVLFLVAAFTGYAAGWYRGVPVEEAHGSDRTLIAIVSLVGVALAAMDAATTRARLDRLLMAACWSGGVMSAVGIGQKVTGRDISVYVRLPGLKYNRPLVGFKTRGGVGTDTLNRIAGTALHYIEFGAVLALLLPIAIHYAMHTEPGRLRQLRWALVGLLAAGAPLAIARSAALGLVLALVVLACVWRPRYIGLGLVASVVGLAAMRLAFPGVLGTIKALFTHLGEDPSISGRTGDYTAVADFVRQRPIFGRGLGTFLPDRFFYLDNQYLGTLIESGYVGLVGIVALFLSPILTGRYIRRHGTDGETRHLGQAFVAVGVVTLVLAGTFDALGFPTFAGLIFLLLGCCGALWRLNIRERQVSETAVVPPLLRPTGDWLRWLPPEVRREPDGLRERVATAAART